MGDSKTTVFGTRLGFYLAAIGSAFGLGNLWRFPYVVAENGGGAFVLLYLLLVFLIGMPLLVGELCLGKISRGSLMPAVRKLLSRRREKHVIYDIRETEARTPRWARWSIRHVGVFSLVVASVVLAYYAVISGWVLYFFMRLCVTALSQTAFAPDQTLNFLLEHGWLQLALTGVHLSVVAIIVAKDLEFGLEKWVGYCMPAFVVLLVGLAFRSLNLDSGDAAVRFLFYPDFSKLRLTSLGQALGHVLFTLSVGFGSVVTFGSYLREGSYLPMTGFRVCALDCLISIWAGVLIFPLVLYSGGENLVGPQLLFQTVPHLVNELPGGTWFGLSFFLCLYLASLGASIGLFETVVANWRESRGVTRPKGSVLTAVGCLAMAVGPALSSNVLSSVRVGSRGLLALLDAAVINWCLPIAALVISQVVCWRLKTKLIRAEFVDPDSPGSEMLFNHWLFVLRYVITPVVVLALTLQTISLLL